tara:strand:+ start:552 stop:1364 length:813 start_codon:yes stop_codon:yes gene_type:complete
MKKLTRRGFIKTTAFAGLGLVLLDSLWFEKYVIDWNVLDFSESQSDKLKVIQITDLHLNGIHSYHRKIVEKINQAKPDILVFTGDSVDNQKGVDLLQSFLDFINLSIQKIAITGNWEYWGNVDLANLRQVYESNNCIFLINENVNLSIRSRKLSVIGFDDYVGGNPDFEKTIEGVETSDTNIVLAHCPEYRDVIAAENSDLKIDLILSGHTHGGQINLLGWVPFKPIGSGRYLKGFYSDYNPRMYVSKGIGTSILPIRFGSQAEILEFYI